MSLIEIEESPKNSKKFPKFFVGVAVSMAIASLGLAVGALINLGGANSGVSELGLGQTLTPACDNAVDFLYFTSIENREDLYHQIVKAKIVLLQLEITMETLYP